jgi:tetratricopeptide (TPR) repeat protein
MPSGDRAVRSRLRGLLVAVALASVPMRVHADAAPQPAFSDSAMGRMLAPYLNGDADSPDTLRRLFRQQSNTIPPPVLLALADGLLRAHKVRMASAALEEALTRTDEPDVAIWAAFGLGWIALAEGDPAAARGRFEVIVQDGDWGAATATTLVTLANASGGAGLAAATRFDDVAEADASSYSLRVANRLLSGYAYYWAGQYAAAAKAFARGATEFPETPLTDDARYAAAWSRYRAGEQEIAIQELRHLAGAERTGAGGVSAALMALRPDGVLRETLRGYRGASMQPPDALLVQMLDLDGRALARAALARVDAPETVPPPEAGIRELDGAVAPAVVEQPRASEQLPPSQDAPRAAPEPRTRTHALWLLLALLAIGAALATRRRRQAGVATTPWRSERR